jgi:hypothetical protein
MKRLLDAGPCHCGPWRHTQQSKAPRADKGESGRHQTADCEINGMLRVSGKMMERAWGVVGDSSSNENSKPAGKPGSSNGDVNVHFKRLKYAPVKLSLQLTPGPSKTRAKPRARLARLQNSERFLS